MELLTPKHVQRPIRKNHKGTLPLHIIYLDTETKKQVSGTSEAHRMSLGWTCTVHKRSQEGKQTEAWDFWDSTWALCDHIHKTAQKGRTLYVFGHNLFFDLQVSDFFFYFTKWGWLLDFVYDMGKTFILIVSREDRVIKCVSTTNYFDTSLAALGKVVGLEKIEVDLNTIDRKTLSTYCKRDVEILKVSMEKYFSFLKDHDLGKFGLSKAAQAFNAYRHRFMNKKIFIHTEKLVIDLEESAYMGGRVEAFRLGEIKEGPVVTLDINSMYPYIMKTCPLPSKFIDYQEDPPIDRVKSALKHLLVVADVDLQTQEPLYAVRHEGKIVFPVGSFRTSVCTPYLTESFERGHLLKIHRAAFYTPDYLFSEYVDYFYPLKSRYREEGNLTYELLCKKMLNSLYGKFGQKQPLMEKTEDVTLDGYWREETVDLETKERSITYKLFNTIVKETGREPARNSLFAIPAHITEWSRFILYSIIERVGRGRVLYCDTDSIKMRKEFLSLIEYPLDSKTLGALKVEKEDAEITILGAKSYITPTERHIKGVPASAQKVGEYLYEYPNFPKIATHMKKRVLRYHIVEKMLKDASPHYDKGKVRDDGYVDPLVFFL